MESKKKHSFYEGAEVLEKGIGDYLELPLEAAMLVFGKDLSEEFENELAKNLDEKWEVKEDGTWVKKEELKK